jgi:hypothetical protein
MRTSVLVALLAEYAERHSHTQPTVEGLGLADLLRLDRNSRWELSIEEMRWRETPHSSAIRCAVMPGTIPHGVEASVRCSRRSQHLSPARTFLGQSHPQIIRSIPLHTIERSS